MPGDYKVGYGRPPIETRFAKGRSGNPRGRPRGTKNLKTDLQEELRERITVREQGGERRYSKQRALVKSLTAKAIKGDARAANVLINMIHRLLEGEAEPAASAPLTADEQAILDTLGRRLKGEQAPAPVQSSEPPTSEPGDTGTGGVDTGPEAQT